MEGRPSLPPHVSLERLAVAPVGACANCGAGQPAAYCAACGQPTVSQRFTVAGLVRRVASDVFDVDRGLLHTAISLFRCPGEAARDYVRGRTVPYVSPLKFFVLAVTLAQLAMVLTGQVGEMADGFTAGLTDEGADAGALKVSHAETTTALGQYLALLVAPSVLLVAAGQRLLFRRGGYNYAEHLIFALYAAARAFLSYVLVVGATEAVARLGGVAVSYAAAATMMGGWAVAMLAYYAADARVCFGYGRASSVVRSLGVWALSVLGAIVATAAVVVAVSSSRGTSPPRRADAAPPPAVGR